MDYKKEIINRINKIAGKYSAYEVFTDWIRCSALSIQNSCTLLHNKVYKDREQLYIDTIKKYTHEEQMILADMFGLLTLALEENMEDVLGDIYMHSGMGSKAAGQFFTPYHLSYLTAKMAGVLPNESGIYTVNEPSCGGGGMIIAYAQVLKEKGINYQKRMDVIAQDLDWKGVYMTYLQLSLLGIKAKVVQGDTICNPYVDGYPIEHVLITPAKIGVLA